MAEMDAIVNDNSEVAIESPSDQTPLFDIAGDLVEGETSPDPSAGSTQSPSSGANDNAFNPNNVDIARAETSSLPPEWQKAQQFVRQHQSASDRRIADLERQVQQTQVSANNQSQAETVKAAVGEVLNAQNPEDPYADLRSRLAAEDRGSIDVVAEVARKEAEKHFQGGQKKLQQLEELTIRMANRIQQQDKLSASQQHQRTISEVNALRNTHGKEIVDDILTTEQGRIKAAVNNTNLATGRPYTVTEAVEAVINLKNNSQANNQNVRRNAQNAIGINGNSISTTELGEDPTNEDLYAMAQRMGFGPSSV